MKIKTIFLSIKINQTLKQYDIRHARENEPYLQHFHVHGRSFASNHSKSTIPTVLIHWEYKHNKSENENLK
jgi:hypothetical protein